MLSGAASGGLGAALNGGDVFSGAVLGGIMGAGIGLATLGVGTAIGYGLNSTFPNFNGGGLRFFSENTTLQGSLASMLPQFGSVINGVSNVSLGSGIIGGIMGGMSPSIVGINTNLLTRPTIRPLYTSSSVEFTGNTYYNNNGGYVLGNLTWMDHFSDGSTRLNDYWSAVSGPFGNGALNQGQWCATSATDDPKYLLPGMYREDVGWKILMIDQMGRTGIRIHPDNPDPFGTEGCIGIIASGERLLTLYNKFSNYFRRHVNMNVCVSW